MNLYEQIDYKDYHINIYYDDDPLDPRKDFDNLGTLYTAHRRYHPCLLYTSDAADEL